MNEMRFQADAQCWNVYDKEEMLCLLRCGDAMLIQVGKHFLTSNLELDTDWFVKFGNSKFWLRRHAKSTVHGPYSDCSSEQFFYADKKQAKYNRLHKGSDVKQKATVIGGSEFAVN